MAYLCDAALQFCNVVIDFGDGRTLRADASVLVHFCDTLRNLWADCPPEGPPYTLSLRGQDASATAMVLGHLYQKAQDWLPSDETDVDPTLVCNVLEVARFLGCKPVLDLTEAYLRRAVDAMSIHALAILGDFASVGFEPPLNLVQVGHIDRDFDMALFQQQPRMCVADCVRVDLTDGCTWTNGLLELSWSLRDGLEGPCVDTVSFRLCAHKFAFVQITTIDIRNRRRRRFPFVVYDGKVVVKEFVPKIWKILQGRPTDVLSLIVDAAM